MIKCRKIPKNSGKYQKFEENVKKIIKNWKKLQIQSIVSERSVRKCLENIGKYKKILGKLSENSKFVFNLQVLDLLSKKY